MTWFNGLFVLINFQSLFENIRIKISINNWKYFMIMHEYFMMECNLNVIFSFEVFAFEVFPENMGLDTCKKFVILVI